MQMDRRLEICKSIPKGARDWPFIFHRFAIVSLFLFLVPPIRFIFDLIIIKINKKKTGRCRWPRQFQCDLFIIFFMLLSVVAVFGQFHPADWLRNGSIFPFLISPSR